MDQVHYLRHLFGAPHRVLEEIDARHGPVVQLGIGPGRLAIVGDPAVIADLFAQPTESYRWNHRFNVLALWVGKGSMVTSDGEDHRRRRRAVQAGFSRRRLNGWTPMIVDATDAAIDRLIASLDEPGEVVDLYPVGRALVLDIVVRVLGGDHLARRTPEISDRLRRVQDLLEGSALRQLPHPFPVGRRHRVRRDREGFDAIVDHEIARIRADPDRGSDDGDVLRGLVTSGDLTDAEIRDQMVTLIGAGYDTTSSALAWTLLRAAAEPDLWGRLAAEAERALGPVGAGGSQEHPSLGALPLAERTVRESLRLHPPGAFGVREAIVDIDAGGYRIPRHTLIGWSMHLAGRDPVHWPEPMRFDPDRHLDPSPEQAALAKMAWVPFGGGARNCLGFALAQIELTLVLARLAQRLDLERLDTAVPPATRRSRPEGGAPLRVTPR